jgi:hypothetical protein
MTRLAMPLPRHWRHAHSIVVRCVAVTAFKHLATGRCANAARIQVNVVSELEVRTLAKAGTVLAHAPDRLRSVGVAQR